MPTRSNQPELTIAFDDACGLCRRSVAWLARRGRRAGLVWRPLSDPAVRAQFERLLAGDERPDSVLVVDGGRVLARSDALLAVVRRLPGPWWALGALRVVPRSWRDRAYDAIASRRHRWFARSASACRVRPPKPTIGADDASTSSPGAGAA
jgi:predicted DCC family thiol-disulfide oxidoreductase YuxK